jgi:hypothetical protein
MDLLSDLHKVKSLCLGDKLPFDYSPHKDS